MFMVETRAVTFQTHNTTVDKVYLITRSLLLSSVSINYNNNIEYKILNNIAISNGKDNPLTVVDL